MTQAPLFIVAYLVGVTFLLAFGPRQRPALCCALGFPIGLALLVPSLLLVLAAGISCTVWAASAVAGIFLIIHLAYWRRLGLPNPREMRVIALGTLLFVITALCLSSINISQLSYDSHKMIMLARGIGYEHNLDVFTWSELHAWSIFFTIAQFTASYTAVEYLYSVAPLLALSFLTAFGLLLHLSLGAQRKTVWLVLLTVSVLSTTYFFSYHTFYMHSNFLSTVYLFCFVVLFWRAETEHDESMLPAAFVALVAFTLTRVETPIVAVLFLSLTVLQSRLPRSAFVVPYTAFIVVLTGWYALLLEHLPEDSKYLNPKRLMVTLGIVLFVYGFWLACRWQVVRRFVAMIPPLAVIAAILALVVTFAIKPSHMSESTLAFAENLGDYRFWSGFWYAVPVFAVLGLLVPEVKFGKVFSFGIPLYLVLLVILGAMRLPYRVGYFDSANRMALHVMPLLLFYFGLKFIPQDSRS